MTTTERTTEGLGETIARVQAAILETRKASAERSPERLTRADAMRQGYRRLDGMGAIFAQGPSGSLAARITGSIAARFHIDPGDLLAESVDNLAVWVGRDSTRADYFRQGRYHFSGKDYAAIMLRKVARTTAQRMATGSGSMPRLELEDSELVAAANGVYVIASRSNDDERTPRGMTESESLQWRKLARYERAESDDYSPWLRHDGESAPSVGTPHPFGESAQYVPSRHAAGLRRMTLAEVLTEWVGSDSARSADANLVLMAQDSVRTTTRGSHVIEWAKVYASATALGEQRSHSAIRRAVERTLTALQDIGRTTAPIPNDSAEWVTAQRHSHNGTCDHSRFWAMRGDTREDYIRTLWNDPTESADETRCQCGAKDCATRTARVERIARVQSAETREDYVHAIA